MDNGGRRHSMSSFGRHSGKPDARYRPVSLNRRSRLVASAALRAVAHLIPTTCPFLAPGEGQSTGQAGFDRQLAFFHGWSSARFATRLGRVTSSPLQFGQRPPSGPSAQGAQKVHSKEQMRASGESGGRAQSQRSQVGRNSSTGLSPMGSHERTMADLPGGSSLRPRRLLASPRFSRSPLRGRRNEGSCARRFWPRTAHRRRKPSGDRSC